MIISNTLISEEAVLCTILLATTMAKADFNQAIYNPKAVEYMNIPLNNEKIS